MVEAYDYIWGYAVATIEEALLLRKAGIKKPILILGFVFPDAYEEVVKYDIRPAVFKLSMARQLSEEAVRQGKTVHVHIKVDTGMSRIGFKDNAESADIVKEISQLPNLDTEGLFTHFARADETDKTPAEVRELIREGVIDFPTAGMCRGYAQANLVILPPEYAADFEEFTRRNPFACPVLEIVRGTPETHDMGEGANIVTDIPRYRSMKTESSQKSLQTRLHTGRGIYGLSHRLLLFL